LIFHRSREFGCYADLPGVGGGRDESYNRFDNLRVQDQGGEAWFTSKEGKRLEILAVVSLFGFLNRWNSIAMTEIEPEPRAAFESLGPY